ncbi:T9SS type A sorting domain-containing protein, partial [Neolewinella agarilytica]|uniref:T9SS type A sorting domain-containing protein n=1 Tax=Neolewinella agarilytica TaxID=478744 RepID=UPI0023568997
EGGLNLNRAGEGLIGVAMRNLSPDPFRFAASPLSSVSPLRGPEERGDVDARSARERVAVLSITVRATEAGRLSELVSLTGALVRTEGVNLNGESTGLGLAFNGSSLAPAVSALLQNTPNPVLNTTTLRFVMATAGRATLSVRDASGRIVLVRQLDAIAGMNQIELTAKDLGAAGVLTYTLTSGDFSGTRKMVVVR